ncbi:MAG TPA: hypothetical protein VGI63_01665 [Verrucomicrobiae bacterium]
MKTKIKYLLVLVLTSFVFAGCATSHCGNCKTAQWEYKVETLQSGFEVGKLNELGKDGWILVAIHNGTPSNQGKNDSFDQYVFKRLKQ